jgi:hypothetical protein
MRAWKCRITATSVREYLTLPATCLRPTWVPSCLVGRTPLVALEVLEVDAGRKLVVVDRHDDPIQFRLLFWLGQVRAAHMSGVDWRGNSASEGLSTDRKSSEIFAAIERRLRADQEEGNHSAWAAAGSVDSSLNLLGVRSPSERAFKASIIEASSYHREWRAPLPRRKSTNPPANSCGREVTLLPSGCSRT